MKKAGVSGYFLGRVYRNVLAPESTIAWELYQELLSGFTIALISHSLDPSLSLSVEGFLWELYRD